jgi:hypothetical protein
VQDHVEVWRGSDRERVPLSGDQVTIGRNDANTLVLHDPTVSQVHAVLERYGTGWCLRDVGSTNGTFLNGDRVRGEIRLRSGDEIRVGQGSLVFRSSVVHHVSDTETVEGAPETTRREREVLVALCRPMLGSDAFNPPSSIRDIADELFVSEAAVKFHLGNLYDKFGIQDVTGSRRIRLANEAFRRRAVTVGDLTKPANR